MEPERIPINYGIVNWLTTVFFPSTSQRIKTTFPHSPHLFEEALIHFGMMDQSSELLAKTL